MIFLFFIFEERTIVAATKGQSSPLLAAVPDIILEIAHLADTYLNIPPVVAPSTAMTAPRGILFFQSTN